MILRSRLFPALFCCLLLSLTLSSCKRQTVEWDLDMPPTPIMTGTTGWGVVNTAYLKINQNPDDDQVVVTTLREGDIVRIEKTRFLKDDPGRNITVWYHIRWEDLAGWVRDSYLDTYDTREKAVTGSRMLTDRSASP